MIQMDAITVVFYAAVIGAVSALLGGIVAGIFSLITTSASNKSRLREIAFEKRLDAFREMTRIITEIRLALVDYSLALSTKDTSEENKQKYFAMRKKLISCIHESTEVHLYNRVILPPEVDKAIKSVITVFTSISTEATKDPELVKKWIADVNKSEKEALSVMRKYINYK